MWSSTQFMFGAFTPCTHYTFNFDSYRFSTITPVTIELKWNIVKLLRKYSDRLEIGRLYTRKYRLHAFLHRLFEMFSRIIRLYRIRLKNTFYVVYLYNRMTCLWTSYKGMGYWYWILAPSAVGEDTGLPYATKIAIVAW
jgi:hypothetical protein